MGSVFCGSIFLSPVLKLFLFWRTTLDGARDLIIFNVLVGLAAVHFLLKTLGTYLEKATWVFLTMWIMSLVLLVWLRVYGGERGDIVDYDENLKRDHLPIIFGAVAAMVIVSSVLVSSFTRSAIYVPRPGLALSLGHLSTAGLVDDLLYNVVLVAPAEESMKLVGILALYRRTRNTPISVAAPVGFWAVLHAYQSYQGELMPILVFSAFLSGIILFLVLKYTRSLLNAQIAHAGFNSIVILMSFLA